MGDADVPGLPDAPPPARCGTPRWHDWAAFGAFNVALAEFGALTVGGSQRVAYGVVLLGAALAAGWWQYRWPRDLAERLTVPAVLTVLTGVAAFVPAGSFRVTASYAGVLVGAAAGLVLGERLRRARRGGALPGP